MQVVDSFKPIRCMLYNPPVKSSSNGRLQLVLNLREHIGAILFLLDKGSRGFRMDKLATASFRTRVRLNPCHF